ncbi:MAG: MarR family winged helix-turn-helix transcriptional regulator [Janthinobacterium lividum]
MSVPSDSSRLKRIAEFRYQLRRFLNFSETAAERAGIAPQQYQLMQVIGALPSGESASITYLSERMILRHNSTVELVDRAERAGLVRRTSDERDLRRSLVVLTSHGELVMEALVIAHLTQLDGDAGDQLLRSLGELRASAREASLTMERSS